MYFPTAEIHANPLLPPLVALGISFFTSMGGVSGAFLLLPFQMSVLGYVNPSVSATNQLYNVFANPAAIVRYAREQRMLWPLAWLIVAGSIPGVMAGALVRVVYLPDPRFFKLFVGLVLLGIAAQMCIKHKQHAETNDASTCPNTQQVKVVERNTKHVSYCFAGELFHISVLRVLLLSVAVGVVGGIYGIGGGAIMSPFLVSLMGLPVHTVAGATLFGTCLTSVAGVAFYMVIAPWFPDVSIAPDWRMALLLSAGGFVGMYFGARCQKRVPAGFIKAGLLLVLAGTGGNYIFGFFK